MVRIFTPLASKGLFPGQAVPSAASAGPTVAQAGGKDLIRPSFLDPLFPMLEYGAGGCRYNAWG
jgi:hypothetical protein